MKQPTKSRSLMMLAKKSLYCILKKMLQMFQFVEFSEITAFKIECIFVGQAKAT